MGLLHIEGNIHVLARNLFDQQMAAEVDFASHLDELDKQKTLDDFEDTAALLLMALKLEDKKIFPYHCLWRYRLLQARMENYPAEQLCKQMCKHYDSLEQALVKTVDSKAQVMLAGMIDDAKQALMQECLQAAQPVEEIKNDYKEEMEKYLAYLIATDARGALCLVAEYCRRGIPLENIYVDIIGKAMVRVGEMWHQNIITVDKEHYCTSITQLAISQLYPIIFGRNERKEKRKLMVACVGSELHELAARMVADLFENDGWESVYLGAAVPVESILTAIKEHQPNALALSVTMPQHLLLCKEAVEKVRQAYPEIKIAVGGNAFEFTDEIYKKWSVDVCVSDIRELVKWMNNTFDKLYD